MIDQTITAFVDDLNVHLAGRYNINPLVSINNIASQDWKNMQPTSTSTGQVFANLINVQEDTTFANQPRFDINQNYLSRPLRLHLYLLLAFKSNSYLQSIRLLSAVLEYYHEHPVHQFTLTDPTGVQRDAEIEINHHNVDLEDTHNMWSNLGGEQHPFAMYKIQLLESRPAEPTPTLIQQVNI